MGGRPWTDEEIGMAITLPTKEAMELLGRTASAIEHVRKRAREGDPALGTQGSRYTKPYQIGPRLLLAKTCPGCGWLLDAKFFGVTRGDKSWRTRCSWCRSRQVIERRKARPQKSDLSRAMEARRRAIEAVGATPRARYTWTLEDHLIASDPTLTIVEKAQKTGRSYRAIEAACAKNKYRSFPRGRLGGKEDGQWQLRFKEAS